MISQLEALPDNSRLRQPLSKLLAGSWTGADAYYATKAAGGDTPEFALKGHEDVWDSTGIFSSM